MNDSLCAGDEGATDKTDTIEGATVVEESLVLLNFPEFQATSLFDNATFQPVSEDANGATFTIDNCSFQTLRLEGLHTAEPSCMLNGQVPLQGKCTPTGVTYFVFDIQEGNDSSDGSRKSTVKKRWHTTNCVDFMTQS
ncbi:hypothetical protein X943_003107 [Babesia divergens]|uniref:Uncharacterized protein n=1 Tax=Babesia divergens TaxID=32595 RepID=A0AAD9G7K9_BABDI|nr:hypothetical protein X943_003107 [Babesia divergens]